MSHRINRLTCIHILIFFFFFLDLKADLEREARVDLDQLLEIVTADINRVFLRLFAVD